MNKTAKRIIAGVSAAVMFVSAVGVGTFTNSFMKTSYADSGSIGKIGRSTGFSNLEKDTDGEKYNTGYGLHTNKTATEAADIKDGRTFDVNLESWYVGENPVDVATVLDASGSMAWTVDTLDPLEINDKEISEILENKDYDDDGDCDIQDAIAYQNTNGGYLPQDVVDTILNPKNTDDSKLSYAGYKYYIYETRSSVSEFVPLGYWDGGKTVDNLNPIGYYPFEGSLENKASNIHGKSATYIKHAEETGNVFGDEAPIQIIEPTFVDNDPKTLDLKATAENGGLMLDINTPEQFTIAMRIKADTFALDKNIYEELPFFYIGDLNSENYIELVRSGSDARNLKVYHNGTNIINYSGGTKKPFHDADWVNVCLSYDGENIVINEYDNSSNTSIGSESNTLVDFPTDNMKIIIGGDIDGHAGNYSDMQLSEFCVFNKALSGDDLKTLNTNKNIKSYSEIEKIDGLVGFYDFGDDPTRGQLENFVSRNSLKLIEQAKDGVFSGKEIASRVATPTYSSEKYNGSHSLNVTQTSKWGSVLLDAVPKSTDKFTISFAIKHEKKDNDEKNGIAQIMYMGDLDIGTKKYYHIARNGQLKDGTEINDDRHLRFHNINQEKTSAIVYIPHVFDEDPKWSYVTYVIDGTNITAYKDGGAPDIKFGLTKLDAINFIIAGLKEEYDGSDILIDDLYVFDQALSEEEVKLVYNDRAAGNTTVAAESCGKYHAVTMDDKAIAQISKELMENKKIDERRGWYYVNSHSNWTDIGGCLESGKQYIAIAKDPSLGEIPTDATVFDSHTGYKVNKDGLNEDEIKKDSQSFATIPSIWVTGHYLIQNKNKGTLNKEEEETLKEMGEEKAQQYYDFYEKLIAGNDAEKEYESPDEERSIRFYVDSQGYLRCFYCTGDTSWKADSKAEQWNYNPRTFCSLVYAKKTDAPDEQITKYEQLNSALNQFYENLAEHSDLTNSAIVRFSTNNVVGDDTTTTSDNLKMLVMKDWTNWSDEYISDNKLTKDKYLENLLIPTDGETSIDTTESTSRGGFLEYPYVMTGGTYTWTGLKAFYDNMVNTEKLKSGDKVYDIANDARDKYLIIFTDGRDNLVGDEKSDKSAKDFSPEGHEVTHDSELAEAWADKLKEEGYTIYCVMMATGSISPTANTDEYNKAHDFLKTLAGSTEADKELADLTKQLADETAKTEPDGKIVDSLQEQIAEFEKYVIVADPSSKGNTTVEAFQQILTQIQQPRNDYTVQDYIDPRFNLVDKDGNLYQLGAGGNITIKKTSGETESVKVGNVIKAINGDPDITEAECKKLGLAYTPQYSYMVNRSKTSDGYDNGDGVGTGYIYYDDEKDMYYLRWTDQIIPMENKAFDTEPDNKQYLNVWSATIRLKAKDDFIGGNDILTNGNEAGENLVYSDATIENMDKNAELYFTTEELEEFKDSAGKYNVPYRKKLEALSGTNRKINAVDAGGVSQAVYGNGIDIPSSGFPRVVVDVRLKPLDAKDLNDVIYMGEVISPTMMLADLENGYMTGSYYLEYLERYAYRVYGEKADQMPLIELLNQWLKINIKEEAEKTFTIPYIYLPDPKYNNDGKLATEGGKVVIENSAGLDSGLSEEDAFNDLNLRDVTGFITYTWKRENPQEEQQEMEDQPGKYDITREYVVKNAKQIKYNLQLKFTPLKDDKKKLADFELDNHFITASSGSGVGDKFFDIENGEFNDIGVIKWSIDGRAEYLKAMVSETKTYEPHVMYSKADGKWVLVDKDSTLGFAPTDAVADYEKRDETKQTTANSSDNTVTDTGVYDWDSDYKKAVGSEQIEGDKLKEKGYYTNDCKNVALADKDGTIITDPEGKLIDGKSAADAYSLVANTTYIKDVVNGALALELVVDGKYLQDGSPITASGKTYTFEAIRYYDDPLDPLPYGANEKKNADTGDANAATGVNGKNYQLTFKVDPGSIPTGPKPDELYTVWANLVKVEVEDSDTPGTYIDIIDSTADKPYLGYTDVDSLPIGTYVISTVADATKNNSLKNSQFKIGQEEGVDKYFEHLKLDNASSSYTYDRFPESVYNVSSYAATDTGDNEYLINNAGVDNAPKNIADCNRTKDVATKTQELTFYFGTVDKKTINETVLTNTKGYDRNDTINHGEDYAKDRLGIILLSVNPNSLVISKKITNTKDDTYDNKFWQFNITFKPNADEDNMRDFETKNGSSADGFALTWYQGDDIRDASAMGSDYPPTGTDPYPSTIKFSDPDGDGTYTATVYLKHNEKVRINGLPEGTWQVKEEENRDLFYSPHNNAHGLGDGEWEYERADATSPNIQLNPASHVDFVNEFPYELPSAGGIGVDQFIFFGTVATVTVALTVIASYYKRRKRRRIN